MFKKITIITALLLSACTATPQPAANLSVVTTIPALYSLTATLTEGTATTVANLLPPNASIHSYSLTPSAAKTLATADLVVINGLGLETFLNDILKENSATVVDSSVGVPTLANKDPHIWLSPPNAQIQSQNIYKALVTADPENSEIYSENYQFLSIRLAQLDYDLQSRLDQLDLTPYIVFHDAYQYFEQHFDVHSTAFLEEFAGREPSAEEIANIVKLIQEKSPKVIFTEPQFSPKLAQTLSEDYGIQLATLDPLGSTASKDGYFELLDSNVRSFESVFNQK